jgi:hypothetical protein
MKWIKLWHGISEDPKLRLAARYAKARAHDVLAVWIVILDDAAEDDHWGVCVKGEDYISAALDYDPDDDTVERCVAALKVVGMIDVGDGVITIPAWAKRQSEDATSKLRQRRHRATRSRDGHVTPRDGHALSHPKTKTQTQKETQTLGDRALLPTEVETSTSSRSARTGEAYAFAGQTIRLLAADLERWRKAYPHLSLESELYALDDWAAQFATGKWWVPVQKVLAKKNRAAKTAIDTAKAVAVTNGAGAGMFAKRL